MAELFHEPNNLKGREIKIYNFRFKKHHNTCEMKIN